MPRLRGRELETAEQQVGQDNPRRMKSTGPAKDSLEPAKIEIVDQPVRKEWADAMAFNETLVTIRVHEDNSPTANPIPDVYVNGTPQRFFRGQEQTVKWKYVEKLARSKRTTFTQRKERLPNGDESYINDPHTALQYDFSLMKAPSQEYYDKLKVILAEPA